MSKTDDPRIILYALFDQTRETLFKAVELELSQYQMNSHQIKILYILYRNNDRMTLNELASESVREINSISALIARMQKKGLVKKVKNSSNERLYVTLTDKGKDIYENTVTERSISLIFDVLSEEERIKLESMLLKLQYKARDLLGLDFKPPLLEQLKSGENNPMVESP